MPNIGLPEIAIVLVIVLVIFGPKRLPELGRSMGRGMREFKDSITGKDDEKEARTELPASNEQATPAPPAGDAAASPPAEGDRTQVADRS
jgi:sec-independent protein translocase protein TatA